MFVVDSIVKKTDQNCRRVAINMQVQQLCSDEEEAVGVVDLWACFVGKADMFMRGITDQ